LAEDRPKVVLLGDSIRESYQPIVKEILDGRADVVGPDENCQFSAHTLANLDRWLEELGRPEVVHWNNGIHDVGHNPAREPVQFALQDYLSNLRAILAKLAATGAKTIWATTTPVHPERPFVPDAWSWRNNEIDEYNAAARELMESSGLHVNDLHAVVAADPGRYLAEDMLHLSDEGKRSCADAVARAITSALGGA
jgi:lysophospholipase L1-like esterase